MIRGYQRLRIAMQSLGWKLNFEAWRINHHSRKPVQCLTTSKSSKEPFLCILPLTDPKEIPAPPPPIPLLKKLQRAMRSPLSLLFCKIDKPKVPSHSSQLLAFSPFTCFVAFHWMRPRTFTSFLNCVPQNCTQC